MGVYEPIDPGSGCCGALRSEVKKEAASPRLALGDMSAAARRSTPIPYPP